jgi:glycosyltransferase involved in cell wall biosynthesis
MREPRISVVIPTFDRAHFLPETLASVLGQSVIDLEVIVVDDGSTDDTAEVLAGTSALRDPRLTYLPLPRSGNLARARNTGLVRARGEVIAFLDSDDLLEEGALAACLEALAAHPETGWTLAGYRTFDAAGIQRTNLHPLPGQEAAEGTVTVAALFLPVLRGWDPIYTSTVALRRSLLATVGPFEEALRTGECDFFVRLAHAAPAVILHRPLVRIRKHPGNSSPHLDVEAYVDAIHGLERFSGEIPRELREEMLLRYRSRLGRCLLERGERRAARREFLKCLRLKPTFGPAWLGLAGAFLKHSKSKY